MRSLRAFERLLRIRPIHYSGIRRKGSPSSRSASWVMSAPRTIGLSETRPRRDPPSSAGRVSISRQCPRRVLVPGPLHLRRRRAQRRGPGANGRPTRPVGRQCDRHRGALESCLIEMKPKPFAATMGNVTETVPRKTAAKLRPGPATARTAASPGRRGPPA
jgi:hypothetical protein